MMMMMRMMQEGNPDIVKSNALTQNRISLRMTTIQENKYLQRR